MARLSGRNLNWERASRLATHFASVSICELHKPRRGGYRSVAFEGHWPRGRMHSFEAKSKGQGGPRDVNEPRGPALNRELFVPLPVLEDNGV